MCNFDHHNAYTSIKGGIFLAYLWVETIGFVICLGIVGGVFFSGIKSAVNPQDSTRIDMNDSPKRHE